MRQRFPDESDNIILNDRDDVISHQAEAAGNLKPPSLLADIPEPTRQVVQQMNRFEGSGGVNMPYTATDGVGSFGTREVARLPGETDSEAALKEAIAGLFNPDRSAPYETVRLSTVGGSQQFRAGRYGLTGDQLGSVLEMFGNPPVRWRAALPPHLAGGNAQLACR